MIGRVVFCIEGILFILFAATAVLSSQTSRLNQLEGSGKIAPINRARIGWQREGSKVYIKAYFISDTGGKVLSYQLRAVKNGASGSSVTSQSGEFHAEPGEVSLSSLVLSLSPGDSCKVELEIFEGTHTLITHDEKIFKGEE